MPPNGVESTRLGVAVLRCARRFSEHLRRRIPDNTRQRRRTGYRDRTPFRARISDGQADQNPSLLGRHVDELGNTIDGERFTDLEVTEAGRWMGYIFLNPTTGEEGIKHSWVVRHDGLVIGSGWYE